MNGTEQDGFASLSAAAQAFAERTYADVTMTAALVRLFVTIPYAWLPADERAYVGSYLEKIGEPRELDDATPILALVGTHGIEAQWNDRATSRDHRAIPLYSEAFVAEAPMIARLLRETGFSLRDAFATNRQFVHETEAGNLFFVGDAAHTTDERGRRIIPAIDFVERYDVRTVYGSGAAFPTEGIVLTGIVFSRKVVTREHAERFAPMVRQLMRSTAALATRETIF